jgi:hypothetical protein
MSALEVVAALMAMAGTGLVVTMVVWLDRASSPAMSMPEVTRVPRERRPAPHRRAA